MKARCVTSNIIPVKRFGFEVGSMVKIELHAAE
jgi:hypothetical protein